MWAACEGDTCAVRDLIERQGASVDVVTKNGLTAIMFAAHNGHTETVAELIRQGASLERCDLSGKTALMFAQNSHRVHTVALIQEHIHASQRTRNSMVTPISDTVTESTNGIDQLVDKNGVKRTALMWAACEGDTCAVRDLIERQGASVDVVTKNGLTAIMFAAHNGHTETVAELIRQGASLERCDLSGKTALMFAQNSHRVHTVALIQEHTNGQAHKVEVEQDVYNLAKTTLFSAAIIGRIDVMNQILEYHKEYIDSTDADGKTLLMFAAEEGHHEAVHQLLFTHGANVEAVDHSGKTAADYAAQSNHILVVQLIKSFQNAGHTAPEIEEEENSATECQICLCDKQPNMAFIPCGHGACEGCCRDLMRSKNTSCHICREPIQKTLKLYL